MSISEDGPAAPDEGGARHRLESPYDRRDAFERFHHRKTRWAVIVAHRRAGKTVACINDLVMSAANCPRRHPRFAYIAPHLNQAKDIAWTYLKDYTRFIPGRQILESELWMQMPGGARIRIYGADNPDRLRGLYLDGVVLDEFGDMDPTVWTKVVRPMLSDRGGWACFIGTPKGKNGFHRLWTASEGDPDWYRLELKASRTGLLDRNELADARKYMDDDEYAQEYECSFDAGVRGAYWAKKMAEIETRDPPQITSVPHDPRLAVHTAWDLGMADSTVIWFIQVCGRETRIIDVLKGEGAGLDWYAKQVLDRGWVWGNHYFPHDVAVRELGNGKSRVDTLHGYGIRATIVPDLPVDDGIQAVRGLLNTCWFDREKCKAGIEALKMYRRKWDERRQEFQGGPMHDWTSHYADAFRYFAVGHRETPAPYRGPIKRDTSWVI